VSEVHDEFRNYFNYFTEVEEHFQKARGTGLFLMSTLDWALVESWKEAGIPLQAVLRGIDAAFVKYHARKRKTQAVNSVTYCAQAVATEAQLMANAGAGELTGTKKEAAPPFTLEEMKSFLEKNAADYRAVGREEFAASLERLAADAEVHYADLEGLEQRLTGLEDKLLAQLKAAQTEEEAFEARRELDLQLRPYRGKMTADQLTMLERQYLDRRLMERANLPRLSLFYMR